MITKELIIKNSKNHLIGGKYVRYGNEDIEISLVGGGKGLYGDFENTFELAIIDRKTKNFVTKYFLNSHDDVCPHLSLKEVLEISNKLLSEGFQFFQK